MRAKTAHSLAAWRAELHRLRPTHDPNALTVQEIATEARRSRAWADAYVKQEVSAGRMKRTTKLVTRGTSQTYPTTAYARV